MALSRPKSTAPSRVLLLLLVCLQGAEKPIIILGTVRTTDPSFINEPTRLNVSLTRAKNHLFIIGKSAALKQDDKFQTILVTARTRPGWYQPNPKAAQDRLSKLTINEALLVEPPAGAANEAVASDVSTRELAWQLQHAPRGRQSKKAKHSASDTASTSSAAPAAADQDDWLEDDSSSEEEEEAKQADAEKQQDDDDEEEEGEMGSDGLEGLSPYSRQAAQAAAEQSAPTSSSAAASVAAAAASSSTPASMDLDAFLAKQSAKEAKRRAAQEARDAQRRPDSDSSDGEMDIMDAQRHAQREEEQPPSQSTATSIEDQPISRMQAASHSSASPFHPGGVRAALARSRASSSSSEASSQ